MLCARPALLLLLTLACSDAPVTGTMEAGPGEDASSDTDSSTDRDTDTDSSTDGDTDSDTDSDSVTDTDTDTDTTPRYTKSPKRGLAYNVVQQEDLAALGPGVSWWYNWYFTTSADTAVAADEELAFVPMLWGHNAESDYAALESWLLVHPHVQHVLVMNEPNLTDQANITPQGAVSHWLRYEAFQDRMRTEHGREILLVGPAVTWGTMPGYADPIAWMDAFYSAFEAAEGREPRIDRLAFHWYDYGLDEQLTRLEKYDKPFWVTEMANWHSEPGWTIDTPEKQLETMQDMVAICERRADVERYAWFMGRWSPDPHHTSIFAEAPGELTALGEAYLTEPWSE